MKTESFFFSDYLTAKDCADRYNTTPVAESLESVGLDNRPPCYMVYLNETDAADWRKTGNL